MAITTYSELQTAVADWLNRSDLTAVVPNFISLAEVQMERVLRVRQMVKRATADLDSQFSTVPADFLAPWRYKLTSTTPVTTLEFVTADAIDDLDAENSAPGRPRHFSIIGNQIRVNPIPDATYTGELTYYAQLDKLSGTTTTNWLLTSAPDVYLYGSLLQAAPYLKDEAMAQTWQALYSAGVSALLAADESNSTSHGRLLIRTKSFGG